jgi:hypothetical protein
MRRVNQGENPFSAFRLSRYSMIFFKFYHMSHLQNDLARDRKDLLPGVSIAFCHAVGVFYTFLGGYAPVRTILGLARP